MEREPASSLRVSFGGPPPSHCVFAVEVSRPSFFFFCSSVSQRALVASSEFALLGPPWLHAFIQCTGRPTYVCLVQRTRRRRCTAQCERVQKPSERNDDLFFFCGGPARQPIAFLV